MSVSGNATHPLHAIQYKALTGHNRLFLTFNNKCNHARANRISILQKLIKLDISIYDAEYLFCQFHAGKDSGVFYQKVCFAGCPFGDTGQGSMITGTDIFLKRVPDEIFKIHDMCRSYDMQRCMIFYLWPQISVINKKATRSLVRAICLVLLLTRIIV